MMAEKALVSCLLVCLFVCTHAHAESRDFTCFQVAAPYSPEIDIGADVAIVYGVNPSFQNRANAWKEKGYAIGMMTGIAWGGYSSYFGAGDDFRKDEVQTRKDGTLFMHGHSKTVGYNVPTDGYIEFLKAYVTPAVEAGVQSIYLEEPEYWATTGWSSAFKDEWQRFYGEPWEPPDSSVDAQYRASKLKYELYFKALQSVMAHIDRKASERGISVECHVPTHSMINYAHWRIVSPESHLLDIPELDGYVAQVWTGTARTPNIYQGVSKERTFETAFLEFGQMASMVRPTEKKVWFLADPVEDNPNRSWSDYKRNYECTIIASLMWPEVHRFEVMPWPNRIFKGNYPKVDMDAKSDAREGIPAEYATQVLIAINALNEMAQEDVSWDSGTRGIGVFVSDTMMFQRAEPSHSDNALGGFYGLALPLLKAGVPVAPVQLENSPHPDSLTPYSVLLLTYEHQKPLQPAYHAAIDAWVRNGGCLLYVGDGADPYHGVREWWNDQGATDAKACDDLFHRLGLTEKSRRIPQKMGKGYVRVVEERPSQLQHSAGGAAKVRGWVDELLACTGARLETRSHLLVRRGPFVVASVLDETLEEKPVLELGGSLVDLLNPELPIIKEKSLQTGERTLLYDLHYAKKAGLRAKVVAAGARIREEQLDNGRFTFLARGPAHTTATARVLLPARPASVLTEPLCDLQQAWHAESSTLWLSFPNLPEGVTVLCELDGQR